MVLIHYTSILSLTILAFSCSSTKIENSNQDWRKRCRDQICLYIKQNPKDYSETFEVKSEIEFPITFTLNVEFAQASSIPHVNKGEITKIIPPLTRSDLLVINPQNSDEELVLNFLYWWNIGKPHQTHNDSIIYRLPFATGKKIFSVKNEDGPKFSVDWPTEEGTQIYAARGGIIIDLKNNSAIGGPNSAFTEDANFIQVLHQDGTRAKYSHLKKNSIVVKIGETIQEGQFLALSGNTGFLLKPKLHFVVDKIINGRLSESLPIKFKSKEKKNSFPGIGESLTVLD